MILLIDNYDSFTYNLYQIIAQSSFEVRVIRNDQLSLQEIRDLQPKAIVISPGPGNPKEAGICVDLIQGMASEVPILGICLGHQAIGAAFGGNVVRAPEIIHGKSSPVFHGGNGLFAGMPQPFAAGRYHSLVVDRSSFPMDLEIEAETENGLVMALKHRFYPCYGFQFHPESILTQDGERLVRQFLETIVRKN